MKRWSFSRAGATVAVATMIALAAVGCTEKLDSSAGCPLTCADQSVQISTVTLDAVKVDSTVLGGLGKGTEPEMLVASRGDTLDSRVIIRFDTLPSKSVTSKTDTGVPIGYADSVVLRMFVDSAAHKVAVPITLSLYDVDDTTAVDDTSAAAIAPLFTPARLITTTQFAAGSLVDSIKVRLPTAFVLAKAKAHARFRIGLQASASTSVEFRVFARESGFGPTLAMRISPDTAVPAVIMSPYSLTPSNNLSIARSVSDFTVVVKGTPPPPPGILTIGGLPGTRA